MFPSSSCPEAREAPSYLGGELPRGAEAAYAHHLRSCPTCQAEVEAVRHLQARLLEGPPASVSPDFAARVLAAVREEKHSSWSHFPRPPLWLAWAAAVAVLCGLGSGWIFLHRPTGALRQESAVRGDLALPLETARAEEISSVQEAQAWLLATQEPDGSWDAKRWGGDRRFQPALTALPLLALLEAPATRRDDQLAAVASACASLYRVQDEHGAFGPTFQGAPYNQGIATLALLHAYRQDPRPELKQAVGAALAVILERQTQAGGWGYLYTPMPNLSVSLWHIECLRLAADLGWEKAREPLQRSLAWRTRQAERPFVSDAESNEPDDSPSREGKHEEFAMADFDYSRAYFRTVMLRQETDRESRQQLAHLRHAVRVAQVHGGELSGSWRPDDRWSKVGGRLYTTALASLALN